MCDWSRVTIMCATCATLVRAARRARQEILGLKGRNTYTLAIDDVIGSSRCTFVSPFQNLSGLRLGRPQPRAALVAAPQDFPWAVILRLFGPFGATGSTKRLLVQSFNCHRAHFVFRDF